MKTEAGRIRLTLYYLRVQVDLRPDEITKVVNLIEAPGIRRIKSLSKESRSYRSHKGLDKVKRTPQEVFDERFRIISKAAEDREAALKGLDQWKKPKR